ncbi:hypothetical protein LCGC14_2589740, partial [marine sediment metagenome]
ALLLALLATHLIIYLARWLKIIDSPGVRKIHDAPVPRLGGLALALPALVMSICVLALDNSIGQSFRGIGRQGNLAQRVGHSAREALSIPARVVEAQAAVRHRLNRQPVLLLDE